MKEVEVKIEINNIEVVINTFEGKGCVFSNAVIQQDIVYIPNDIPTVPCPAGTNVLRIRKQDNKSIFTFKRSDVGNHLSKLEHETEICDPAEMDEIIKLLGFKIITDTTKTRRKCKMGEYEICVDEVKDLGSFLEIEQMTEDEPNLAQQKMLEYLNTLGLNTSKRINVGYDVLWVQKYGSGKR